MTESKYASDDPLAVFPDDSPDKEEGEVSDNETSENGAQKEPKLDPAEHDQIDVEGFASEITRTPGCLDMVRAYSGYAGQGGCGDEYWRLYRSLDFNEYIEFHKDHIVNCVKYVEYEGATTDSHFYPDITRTVVWLPVGARIQHGWVRSERVESAFLRGPVAGQAEMSGSAFSVLPTDQAAEGSGNVAGGGFSSRGPC